MFFPVSDYKTLMVTIEAFALQHRKDKFQPWHQRIFRAGAAWGPIIEACMKPMQLHRPTAQQVLEQLRSSEELSG